MRKLIYLFLALLIVACSSDDNNDVGDSNPVYLDSNGVTIKAKEWAILGDTGVINGITYTVVDEAMLREMVANEEDVTKVATTKVTDLSEMFFLGLDSNGDVIYNNFNQDISSWDVNNVSDMSYMFAGSAFFNQPIGDWDLRNVTNMNFMLYYASSFNQSIGNWDVSNVTDMYGMFRWTSAFNQPIGDWDVSNVINMYRMFSFASSFNHPMGNWDVSNVTNMKSMFYSAESFNQDLSSWVVDNVTECLDFCDNIAQWTLPKPNFTNCTP